MLIALREYGVIITAVEGTGDNLLPEDIKEGYVDYLMTNVYKQDGYELVEEDGGQMMLYKLWSEYKEEKETDELVRLILDYWGYDYGESDWVLLDN